MKKVDQVYNEWVEEDTYLEVVSLIKEHQHTSKALKFAFKIGYMKAVETLLDDITNKEIKVI